MHHIVYGNGPAFVKHSRGKRIAASRMLALWGGSRSRLNDLSINRRCKTANGLWCYFLSGAGMSFSAAAPLSAVPVVVVVFVAFFVSLHPMAAITAIRSVAANHFRIAWSPKRGK